MKNVKYTPELTEQLVNILRTVADFSTPNHCKTVEQMTEESQFIALQLDIIRKLLKDQSDERQAV
jgi:hypothetical protein